LVKLRLITLYFNHYIYTFSYTATPNIDQAGKSFDGKQGYLATLTLVTIGKLQDNPWRSLYRAVVSGGAGGALAPSELGVLLTLFQPEGADYAHHITGSTPGFVNLTTALL
jgi:hypothetical protein